MLMTGTGKTARVHYLPGTFRVLSDGDHVICAVTGKKVWITRRIDIARHWLKHHPHA